MNPFDSRTLPGTTLRIITDEWNVFTGFHSLMRQRTTLEAEHLRQLRQFQESIGLNWSKSGVWPLISPVVDLWNSQINILEECNKFLAGFIESCPTEPSPDEPEKGILPSSKYDQLHGPYKVYQDCQTAASSKEVIADLRSWFDASCDEIYTFMPLPIIDKNYRESVVAQRNVSRPIAEWHYKNLPEKLETHVRYAEEMQTCLRDYLVKFSASTSDLVKLISTAQKRLAEFSSLAFIDPSQKCFEDESLHPAIQPAVYLNHWLGGTPAEPVLGVLSYLPKLLTKEPSKKFYAEYLQLGRFLEAEKDSTSFDEVIQKLEGRYRFDQDAFTSIVFVTMGTLLPISEDATRRYKNGIKREEIDLLLRPFPIEKCRVVFTMITSMCPYPIEVIMADRVFGFVDAWQLLVDIWRKWDFENHLPLPRDIVRTLSEWNEETDTWVGGGKLIVKRTGLPYNMVHGIIPEKEPLYM